MFMVFCIYICVLVPISGKTYSSKELVMRLFTTKIVVLFCTFVFYFPGDF